MSYRLLLATAILATFSGSAAAQQTERLYGEACAEGEFIACNVFGLMREHGAGVSQDLTDAATLYRRACEGGVLVGCTNLAILYQAGAGVQYDSARAAGLYRTACEGGELLGCDLLAGLEETFAGTEPQQFFKSGRVGDAATGRALSEAVVEVPGAGLHVVSDVDGRFVLGRLPAGRYLVRAERFGYAPVQGEVEVPGNAEFVILLDHAELDDPTALGRIEGRVTDGGYQGLSDVQVRVRGREGAGALSNQQGRFVLGDLQPGLVELRLARLGYAPRTARLVVQPGRSVEVTVTMSTDPIELEPIQVSVRSSFLDRNGFFRRAERGLGHQLSRLDLDEIQPDLVSDAVQRVPGVRLEVDPLNPNRRFAVSRRGASLTLGLCTLGVYIDGVRMTDPDLNQIPQEWLEGMEVYLGVGTPVEYMRPDQCGVVLLWTQR